MLMMKELSFWSFVALALTHLLVILANRQALRSEDGNHFQIAVRLAKRGGIFGWAFAGSFFLLLASFLALIAFA